MIESKHSKSTAYEKERVLFITSLLHFHQIFIWLLSQLSICINELGAWWLLGLTVTQAKSVVFMCISYIAIILAIAEEIFIRIFAALVNYHFIVIQLSFFLKISSWRCIVCFSLTFVRWCLFEEDVW